MRLAVPVTTLDVPGSLSSSTTADGINDLGQIVGYYQDAARNGHGFLYDQGNYTPLDVPGAYITYATGINASGQIVGYYGDAAGRTHLTRLNYGKALDLVKCTAPRILRSFAR